MDFLTDKTIRLACPECRSSLELWKDGACRCCACQASFPTASGRPVLLKKSNQLFNVDDYIDARTKDYQRTTWASFFPKITADLAVERVVRLLALKLDTSGPGTVLVVGGGCQRAWLSPLICSNVAHRIIYSDIDTAADVDVFCDAHDLPFETGSIDAVITTAVLEHVMYPERAAQEITRVLKMGGLLYSEIPFMQQVHEGAYDFTRYTLSGHRRLFNGFSEIESGMTAGPGSALAWSIESFLRSFFESTRMRMIVTGVSRILCGWLKYVDLYFQKKPQAMDGACGTYFFGMKAEVKTSDDVIIKSYVGGRHLTHS